MKHVSPTLFPCLPLPPVQGARSGGAVCYTRAVMIIAIPDDYHGLVSRLDCFSRLAAHDVRIFKDAAPPFATLAAHLADAEIIARGARPGKARVRHGRRL